MVELRKSTMRLRGPARRGGGGLRNFSASRFLPSDWAKLLGCAVAATALVVLLLPDGEIPSSSSSSSSSSALYIRAPPGSGYIERDDETADEYPDTYEPMMEYPGTMRPGRTPENQAFENLPIADSDPDPVPWPHFQEIEWHHLWEPPHPHPTPMEEFIEMHGRWASVEEEAQMRMDVRRGVRERRELEELEKAGASTLIVDEDEDDEEDEEGGVAGPQLDLGDGVQGIMGAAQEATKERVEEEEVDEDEDEGEVDFLLDLGLDAAGDEDDDDEAGDDDDGDEPALSTAGQSPEDLLSAMRGMIDMGDADEDDDDNSTGVVGDEEDDDVDLDIDLGLLDANDGDDESGQDDGDDDVDDDDDDMGITMIGDDESFGGGSDMGGGFQTIPLDEFSNNEDMGADDGEGFFDDGGFDYD